MNIEAFNKTLSWLDEAVVKSFDDHEFDLVLAIDANGGGPGENVTAFISFKGVCYLSMPMVMSLSDCPQVRLCNFEQSMSLMPIDDLDNGYESEIKDGVMKVLQFFDGEKALSHFVACYGYELRQDPEMWSYE